MASSFGGTVKLTGESEYRKALSQISQNLKEVSSEIKVVTSSFDKNDTSIESTTAKQKVLTKQLMEQTEKLNILKSRYNEIENTYGKNSKKQQELIENIEKEKRKLQEIEMTLGKNSRAYLEQENVISKLENTQKSYNLAISNAKIDMNNARAAINKTNTELNKLENQIPEDTDELKKMQTELENAGQGALKFGDLLKANVLGDFITSGLKAVGNGIKQIGSTFLSVGKDALDSYADYEQLVGGVETLFKDNANTVEQYANNAYKTAGLSANDYMETVTSFSASLLQSLNGDTAKAADVSNRAIVDMADNANKMGTDMTSIQNAYQGFAKQNYTMLDNLKLGYGGTKEEMQRLIKDASKMKDVQKELGVTVDSSSMSFGNIVNAISVMQKKMDIAGTTSKEASTTIQGSVASLKSSWSNLLTGVADDNADWDALVSSLFESIFTAADNILPRVGTIALGMIDLIRDTMTELLPEVVNLGIDFISNSVEEIANYLPNAMQGIAEVGNTILNTFVSLLPDILQVGIDILTNLVQGIAQSLPNLIPTTVDAIVLMTTTLLENIDVIIDAGIQLILGLAEGLINALPNLIEKAPEIIQKLFDALVRSFPKIVQAGGRLISELVSGIIGSAFKLLEVAPKLISNMVNGFKQGLNEIKNVGKYLVEGLWDGITGMASWVGDKVKSFASNIVGNIKDALGIHSPSAILRDQVGKFMAQGIGVGFSDEMINVSKNMQNSIPTEFDVNSTIKTNESSNKLSLENITGAFITAVKNLDAQIIIDKDVAGRFVITSVNDRLGEVL